MFAIIISFAKVELVCALQPCPLHVLAPVLPPSCPSAVTPAASRSLLLKENLLYALWAPRLLVLCCVGRASAKGSPGSTGGCWMLPGASAKGFSCHPMADVAASPSSRAGVRGDEAGTWLWLMPSTLLSLLQMWDLSLVELSVSV